jgi:hypothetical protein
MSAFSGLEGSVCLPRLDQEAEDFASEDEVAW